MAWEPTERLRRDKARVRRGRPQIHPVEFIAGRQIPTSEIQALMEAAPGDQPVSSSETSAHLKERMADALDDLPPRLKWIFEARHYRGMSIRQIGMELNLAKSYIDRLYRQAVVQLQASLSDLVEP